MIRAIYKPTGEIVEAWKLVLDTSWIGKDKEKDNWIAPEPEIDIHKLKELGISEVQVAFIKRHESHKGEFYFDVRDHFRIITEGAIENPENESEEHLLCKEGIYYALLDKEIDIYFGEEIIKGDSLLSNIKELNIEKRLSEDKTTKIGDVVLKFKEEHILLGKGIIFEIQFSLQSPEKTFIRTNDRVLEGYSVAWLWDGMFDNKNKLKNSQVRVISFRKALKNFDEARENKLFNDLNGISKLIDYKKLELEDKGKEIYQQAIKSTNIADSYIDSKINNLKSELEEIANSKKEIIIGEILKDSKERITKLIDLNNSDFKNIILDKLNLKIKEIINDNILEIKNIIQKESDNFKIYVENSIKNFIKDKQQDIQQINLDELLKDIKLITSKKIQEIKEIDIDTKIKESLIDVQGDFKKQLFERLGLQSCDKCGDSIPYSSGNWINEESHQMFVCDSCWKNSQEDKRKKEELKNGVMMYGENN